MVRYVTTGMLLLASVPLLAAETELKSPQAKEAIHKRDAQIAAAESVYKQALLKAKGDCVRDLKIAMTVATRQGNLDDANLIKAELDRTQSEIDQLAGKLRQERFRVAATLMWNDTVQLKKGQRIRIQSVGEWSLNGRKSVADVSKWPPRGRVGDGKPFEIGVDYTLTADKDGILQMGINDGERQDFYNDNFGEIAVTITFLPSEDTGARPVAK